MYYMICLFILKKRSFVHLYQLKDHSIDNMQGTCDAYRNNMIAIAPAISSPYNHCSYNVKMKSNHNS